MGTDSHSTYEGSPQAKESGTSPLGRSKRERFKKKEQEEEESSSLGGFKNQVDVAPGDRGQCGLGRAGEMLDSMFSEGFSN